MRPTASTGNKQSLSIQDSPTHSSGPSWYHSQLFLVTEALTTATAISSQRRLGETSFLGKKAPFWSTILAVIVTAGAFGAATMALPQLSDALQSQRDFTLSSSP